MPFVKKYSFLLLPLLLLFFVFILATFRNENLDTYLHYSMGKVISERGIINYDPFGHHGGSSDIRLYIPSEWLFQVVIYKLQSTFGLESYKFLNAFFAVLQAGIVYLLFRKIIQSNLFISILFTLSFAFLQLQFFIARPYLISYTFLLLTLLLLLMYIKKGKNYLLVIPAITYIWTNLHPSVFLAIYLCGTYSLLSFLYSFIEDKKYLTKAKALALLTIIVSISTILPPQGFNGYKFIWLIYQNSYILTSQVSEWMPLGSYPQQFAIYSQVMAILLILFLSLGIKKKLFLKAIWLYPLLILSPLAYIAIRNMYFGYLSATITIGWLISQTNFSQIKKSWQIFLSIGIFYLMGISVYQVSNVITDPGSFYPVKLVDFLKKEAIQGNMLNQFAYGGYLEYHLYPKYKVFSDGRVDSYLCCELKDWYDLNKSAQNSPEKLREQLDKTLDKYQISFIPIVTENDSSGRAISSVLQNSQSWGRVFEDDLSEVWVKNDNMNPNLYAKSTRFLNKTPRTSNLGSFIDLDNKISFNHPKDLKLTEIDSHLISVSKTDSKNQDNAILIYMTDLSDPSAMSKIPFKVSGNPSQVIKLDKEGFDAKILTYQNGSNYSQFFTLNKDNKMIIIRPPLDNSIDPQIVLDIVQSITLSP